jgi:hypothetical protein
MSDNIYQTIQPLDRRIGVFSDIHLGLGQDSENWHTIMLDFAAWVAKIYRAEGINDILIPGDVFHNRNEIALKTLDTGHKFFEILKEFRIFISSGNHCAWLKNSSEITSLAVLKGRNNIHIIDAHPSTFSITGTNKKLSMIPWGTKTEDIPETDICFGHFELATFALNNHKICQHGEDAQNLFKKSPFIVTGHFHKKEFREYKNGKVLYLGSPYQQNFGDSGDVRGIYIMDLHTNEFEFIENRISPRHYKISIHQLCNGKLTPDQLKSIVPGNMICLVVDKNINADQLSTVTAKIQGLNPLFFRLDYESSSGITSENNSENYTSINVLESIEKFIESTNSTYKAETVEYLAELYHNLT